MNIKDVAARSGLPAKTIRYYEEIGLIRPLRGANGYRAFRDSDLHKLAFLGRARGLGFTIEECRKLLALYEDRERASADVKALAEAHLHDMDRKIAELRAMQATLRDLVASCAGDHRPDCPILQGLAQETPFASDTDHAAPKGLQAAPASCHSAPAAGGQDARPDPRLRRP